MKNMKQHIFIVATEWGGTQGGINLFNKSLVEALGRVVDEDVTVHAAIIERETLPAVTVTGGVLLHSYGGDGASLADMIEHSLNQDKSCALHLLGHDVHSGPAALDARDRLRDAGWQVDASTICHMDYSAYEYLKGAAPGEILDKAERQRDLVRRADHVYAVGPLLKRNFEKARPSDLDDPNIHQLIPGFPDTLSNEGERNPSAALKLFFSGRIDPKLDGVKNSRLVLQSLIRAYENGASQSADSPWHLRGQYVCYGFQPGTTDIEWYCEAAGAHQLGSSFTFQPEIFSDQQAMFRQLKDSHVAVMPSIHEGFGLSGWEALCAGIPLICSDQSGLALFLAACFEGDHELPGESFLPVRLGSGNEDVAALAGAMHDVARTYERRRSHARVLARHLRDRYSWDDCARSVAAPMGLAQQGSVNWSDRQYQGRVATRRTVDAGEAAREVDRAIALCRKGEALSEWSVICTALNYLSDVGKQPTYQSRDLAQKQLAEISAGIEAAYQSLGSAPPPIRGTGRLDVAWRFMAATFGLSGSLGDALRSIAPSMMQEISSDSFLRRELLFYTMRYHDRFETSSNAVARQLFSDLMNADAADEAFQVRFARLEAAYPALSSIAIFDPARHRAYQAEAMRCQAIKGGSFDLNDLLTDEGTLGPSALALATIDQQWAVRGIDQLLVAGQEHGHVAPKPKWRGDKLLRTALLGAAIHPRSVLEFIMALACDEDEALRWAAIDLAFSAALRQRLFRASRIGQVDITVGQLKASLGAIVDKALEAHGFHPWIQREFLEHYHREHSAPVMNDIEDRFTLADFPLGRELLGPPLGQETSWRFETLHPEVLASQRRLRDHCHRILLVLPPIAIGGTSPQVSETSTPPLGLGIVGSQLLASGHDVQLADCHRDPGLVDTVINAASGYQWIGFNTVLPTMRSVLSIATRIKQKANPPTIILGGPAVNARALSNATIDEVERASWDFEIVADAGGNFASLVAGVANGQTLLPTGIIPNPRSQLIIATRQRIPDNAGTSRIVDGAWPHPLLLDRRLFATLAGPYEPQQTRAHGSVVEAHVVMSTGCDWNCTFCTERKNQSGGEQRRSVAAISAELQELTRRNEDLRVQFIDDNLLPQIATRESGDRGRRGQDLDWAERFLDELTEIRSNAEGRFGWRGIFRVEDFLAYEREIPDFLDRLTQSGCRMLAFGIEHGDEDRRRRMKVGQSATNDEFTQLFQRLFAASIHTKGYFILGGPKETPETSEKTIRFALESGVTLAYFAIYKQFVPALKELVQEQPPGSQIHAQFSHYEQLKFDWDEILARGVAAVPDSDFARLVALAGQNPERDGEQFAASYGELAMLGFRFSDLVKYSDMHAPEGPSSDILAKVNFGEQQLFEAKITSAYLRFYIRPQFVETYKALLADGY